MRSLLILILLLLCLFPGINHGQILEKRVSLTYQQVSLARVLAGIKATYGVGFSYANNLIPLDKKVSISVKDKTLKQALDELFKESGISYTLVGQQIVLRKGPDPGPKAKPIKRKNESIKPGGMSSNPVNSDAKTDEIFQPETASLLPIPTLNPETEDGEPKSEKDLQKDFETEKKTLQKNYLSQLDAALEERDTAVSSRLREDFRNLMSSLKKEFKVLARSAKKALSSEKKTSVQPVDSLSQTPKSEPVQVSFVPPLSTNGKENAHSVNTVSFNILAGYSGGLNGVEVGGIANVEKGNVRGVQVAGTANVVAGDVEGTQVAGYVNINKGNLEGVQVAGFVNVSASDSSNAVQVAGFSNIHRGDYYGVQVSGFANINGGYLIGPQVAGFLNVARGPVSGVQVAGFLNASPGNFDGVQVAGFMNVGAKNVVGVQAAGFMNVAKKDIQGVQVASFMNIGNVVHGSQIGLFNFADTVSGVQVGLFNFSRRGYRRLEIFGSEVIHANIAFKMGTRRFHNIFTVGSPDPTIANPRWSYGYGFGSEFWLGKKGLLNLDLVCNQVIEDPKLWTENLNLINQLKVSFGIHPGKRTSLYAGPTLNVSVSRVKDPETGEIGSNLIPDWNFMNRLEGNTRIGIWAGFNAGIRF